MEFEWFVDLFEVISVRGTKFLAWFISELRDYDLTRILESAAALLAIIWTLWKFWTALIKKPGKALLEYLQRRQGEILNRKAQLVAGIAEHGIQERVSPITQFSYVDVDKRIRNAIGLFKRGKTVKSEEELRRLTAHLQEKESLAEEVAKTSRHEAATACMLLGIILYHDQRHHASTEALAQALSLNPQEFDAKKYKGLNALATENYQPAASLFEELAELTGDDQALLAETNRLRGYANLKGQWPGSTMAAINAFRTAVDIEDGIGQRLSIARSRELLGDALRSTARGQAREQYRISRNNYEAMGLTINEARVASKFELLNGADDPTVNWGELILPVSELLLLSFRSQEISRQAVG